MSDERLDAIGEGLALLLMDRMKQLQDEGDMESAKLFVQATVRIMKAQIGEQGAAEVLDQVTDGLFTKIQKAREEGDNN